VPTCGVINFHDGPLPEYAGLNAPVWALLQGESEFGISWHFVTDALEEVPVLVQRRFPIGADETALSLNTRCFEAGLESFTELVDRLLADDTRAQPQGHRARIVFGLHERPEAAGVLDWQARAADLARLVRALDHGRYPNPLTTAKLVHGDVALIAVRAECVEGSGAPGSVLDADASGLTVACADGALRVTELRELSGAPISAEQALERLNLSIGESLHGLDEAQRAHLSAVVAQHCPHESVWTRRLLALEPLALPWPEPAAAATRPAEIRELELPPALMEFSEADRVAAILGAYGVVLARLCGSASATVGLGYDALDAALGATPHFHATRTLLTLPADAGASFAQLRAATQRALEQTQASGSWASDLFARQPGLQDRPAPFTTGGLGLAIELRAHSKAADLGAHDSMVLEVVANGREARLLRNPSRVSEQAADRVGRAFELLLRELLEQPAAPLSSHDLVDQEELHRIVGEWNDTVADLAQDARVHELFEQQALRTPDRTALVFAGQEINYAELERRSAALAAQLSELGAGPEVLVGVHLERSIEMMVAVLGVLRAGAAFVALNPELPSARLAAMVEDAGLGLVVTTGTLRGSLPLPDSVAVVEVDALTSPAAAPTCRVAPESLAYLSYVSSPTGRLNGVMVEHRNVMNLFCGLDARMPPPAEGRWLANHATASEEAALEILWALARGYEVEITPERGATPESRAVDFGLFVWGSDDAPGPRKYELMMEAARFGDTHGFSSISMPERHFHAFGGPYPNPAVTGAAVAAVTQRIGIRSGSSVSPLHHPLRLAEEWAVLDNLSNGRVGLGIASGWWPEDFVLRPESFADKKDRMQRDLDVVRRLWRGESVEFPGHDGVMIARQSLPRPVQAELPVWVTSAGNPETFEIAGRANAHILTHLLGQSVEEVAEKILLYRRARAEAGLDPATGIVTLMLHTCIGDDVEEVREAVRGPLKGYLASATSLVKKAAWNFPAFRRPNAPDAKLDDIDIDALSGEEVNAVLDHAFERYFTASGLFGTPESVQPMIEKLKAIGVNEIGCLIDFGLPMDYVIEHLGPLSKAHQLANQGLELDAGARASSERIDLCGVPETTAWFASTETNPSSPAGSIARPLANVRAYVLDPHGRPLPSGVLGELFLGGAGVARGYFDQPALTAERFLPDPFCAGQRIFATGHRARFRDDGALELLTRKNRQCTIRGHCMELGEIEAALLEHDGVREAVVTADCDPLGESRLTAYYTVHGEGPASAILLDHLRARLHAAAVPAHLFQLGELPRTPLGEIDRRALPKPEERLVAALPDEAEAPQGELQARIAACWRRVLGREQVGARDNFFDIGGHSLLMLRLQLILREALDQRIALTDLYRFPTVQSLAEWLESGGEGDAALSRSAERAEQRRASRPRRRQRGT